jgi:hypothetical protein
VDAPIRLIPNSALTSGQIPDVELRVLDGEAWLGDGAHGERWERLWVFALTFDGWSYFGGDDYVIARLGAFDESIRSAYDTNGELPQVDPCPVAGVPLLRAATPLQAHPHSA